MGEGNDGLGPGYYNSNKTTLSNKFGKFTTAKREFDGSDAAAEGKLGPGAYNTDKNSFGGKKRGWTMGSKPRNGNDGDSLPGPGQYYNGKDLKNRYGSTGVKFARTGRGGNRDDGGIGPGQYGRLGSMFDKKKGGFSFGRSKRSDFGDNDTPGPGFYSKQSSKV